MIGIPRGMPQNTWEISTSAGSIVSALLVAGYGSSGLKMILADAKYPEFADCGFGGKWVGGLYSAVFRRRGWI